MTKSRRKSASSAEFVGSFWLRNVAKLMIQCGRNGFYVLETVRFSHGQFRFVVEPFHYSRGKALVFEPVE